MEISTGAGTPWHSIAGIATVSAFVFLVGLGILSNSNQNLIYRNPLQLKSTTFTSESFSLQRYGYDALPFFDSNTQVTYKFLEDYSAVIEPNALSTIMYSGDEDDMDYMKYYIYNSDGDQLLKGKIYPEPDEKDEYFSIPCEAHSELTVKIIVRKDKEDIGTVEFSAVCIYVRRELRSLSSDDLETVLETMHTMWETSESDGQELYGENYHSIDWFAGMHDFNAAWKDADHFHEGLGFLPQHIKMTNLFELSMQAIEPSVSLFYWDFTIEQENLDTLSDSPMFQSTTFGELSDPIDTTWGWTYRDDSLNDARIASGLWKHAKALDDPGFEYLRNGFGYLRGPWNINPSKYILRFQGTEATLPSCLSYYNWFSTSNLGDFLQMAANAPHASTHGTIGGVYGCDLMDEMREYVDETAQLLICSKWGFYIKELYRANFITVTQDDCDADSDYSADSISCPFTCDDSQASEMIEFMQDSISLGDNVGDIGDDGWEAWRQFVCNGQGNKIFVGDHLEAASPVDPSFWPIHPTQDRLLHFKYLSGGFEDYDWPTVTSRDSSDYVCNHAKCYSWDASGPSSVKNYFSFCCYGHFEYDQLMDFTTGNRSNGFGATNREVLDASDASSSSFSVPYIYDNFDWDHCSQDFDALFTTLMKHSSSRRQRKLSSSAHPNDPDR